MDVQTVSFNQKFKNALLRTTQATPPIWFMRQAGRYHNHYQELRKKHSFWDLCTNPDLAAEVALGPIQDFDFDVAILFSDLLFPLDALGMGLSYDPAPKIKNYLTDDSLAKMISTQEAVAKLGFQKIALQKTRERLPENKSLIGFVGGPWTLFNYAIENLPKKRIKLFSKFCEVLLPILNANIELQLEGGAEVVMIFDTSAGDLNPQMFADYFQNFVNPLITSFPNHIGYYAKGISEAHAGIYFNREDLAGRGFDHRWDIVSILRNQHHGFVQGNFDQDLLTLETDEFESIAERYLLTLAKVPVEERRGWVFGLGHGVTPFAKQENVKKLVQMTREILR